MTVGMSGSINSGSGPSMIDEVSLFMNNVSYVGREVVRRIVLRSADFVREDPDDDKADDDDILILLLRQRCCVRFFSWLETTYVPSYLFLPFSSLWSSELERRGTTRTMLEGSDISVVCRDLFFIRQLMCEIFSIFFIVPELGIVIERRSADINWPYVLALVSSTTYRR